MDAQTLVTIVTSAAVAAIVSAGATMVGQMLERRARRQELLLVKAIEIAQERLKFGRDLAFKVGGRVRFQDPASLAAAYYKVLQHVMEKGELPRDFVETEEQSLKELEKKKEEDASR